MQNEMFVRSNSGAPVFKIDFGRFRRDVTGGVALDQTNGDGVQQLYNDARYELEREINLDEEEVDDPQVNTFI